MSRRGIFARLTTYLTLSMLLALPTAASATAYELSRVATELAHVSQQMARELRGGSGYASIRFSANRLSQEAEQLLEAISRGRNPSHVRRQVDDVRRRYLELEEAVLRLDRAAQSDLLISRMDRVSSLYESINAEFYYTERQFPPRYQALPQPVIVLPQSGFSQYPRQHYPQQSIQQRPGQTRGDTGQARINRFDYGRITTSRQPAYPHRSRVQERQSRQQELLDLGANGPRATSRTETARPNHHDANHRD